MLVEGELGSLERLWAMRVRSLRLHRGLSLYDLASAMGVSEAVLWAYEAGNTQIGAASLWKLSQILEIAIDELVGAPESPRLTATAGRILH
jgi:transcriptional regulator with XRE-family HTH domain